MGAPIKSLPFVLMDVLAYAGEWRRLRETPPYTSLGGVFLFGGTPVLAFTID